MDDTISNQVKEAERDKYIAETAKANSESLKINLEYEEAKKEYLKPWYKKKEFLYNIPKFALWAGFVVFFMNYVVFPTVDYSNKTNLIQLIKDKEKFHNDSIKNHNNLHQKDSILNVFIKALNKSSVDLNAVKKTLDSVSREYSKIVGSLKQKSSSAPMPITTTKDIENLASAIHKTGVTIDALKPSLQLGNFTIKNMTSGAIDFTIVGDAFNKRISLNPGALITFTLPYGKYDIVGSNWKYQITVDKLQNEWDTPSTLPFVPCPPVC